MEQESKDLSFFVHLHRLAQRVDNGVRELQSSLDDRKSDGENNYLTARNLLQDLRKESRNLKPSGADDSDGGLLTRRINLLAKKLELKDDHDSNIPSSSSDKGLNSVAKFEEKGQLFNQTLTALQAFLTTQSRRLIATEDYLEQYGYARHPGKENTTKKDNVNEKATDSEENEVENCTENVTSADPNLASSPVCSELSSSRRAALNRTPRLEDVGISSFTMNYIHKLNTEPHTKPDIIASSQVGDSYGDDGVPSIFNHDGLTLTPSLFGYSVPKETPNSMTGTSKFHQGSVYQERNGRDGKNLMASQQVKDQTKIGSASPPVPVFLAAGAKPINKMRKHSPKAKVQGERSSDSPVAPMFLTPGAKQIKKAWKLSQMEKVMAEGAVHHPAVGQFMTPDSKHTPKDSRLHRVKAENIVRSPAIPQFVTPGAKQINKTPKASQLEKVKSENIVRSPAIPQFVTPGAKQINKALKASEETTVNVAPIIQSPAAPMFITPGAKQIKKSIHEDEAETSEVVEVSGEPKQPVRRKVNTELFKDDEPEPPEFTMSLQDLTELTQSFGIKTEPREPVELIEKVECGLERPTPVMPELLSDHLEKVGMMPQANVMPTCPDGAFKAFGSRIPRPPKLMSSYRFSSDLQENLPPA